MTLDELVIGIVNASMSDESDLRNQLKDLHIKLMASDGYIQFEDKILPDFLNKIFDILQRNNELLKIEAINILSDIGERYASKLIEYNFKNQNTK